MGWPTAIRPVCGARFTTTPGCPKRGALEARNPGQTRPRESNTNLSEPSGCPIPAEPVQVKELELDDTERRIKEAEAALAKL